MHKSATAKQQKQRPKKVVKAPKVAKKVSKVAKKPLVTSKRTVVTSAPRQSLPSFNFTAPMQLNTMAAPVTTLSQPKFQFQPLKMSKRFGGWGYSHYTPAEAVEARIMKILQTLPAVDQSKLTNKAHFQKDLGLDSLQQVELIFSFEQEFKVEINDDDAILIETVPEAVHYFSHTPYTV